MKNKDKFKDRIFEIACTGSSIAFDRETNELCSCTDMRCSKCSFLTPDDIDCNENIKKWCESEYVENEDENLKWYHVDVGTPVLVKDSDSNVWNAMRFKQYLNGNIYVVDGFNSTCIVTPDEVRINHEINIGKTYKYRCKDTSVLSLHRLENYIPNDDTGIFMRFSDRKVYTFRMDEMEYWV